MRRLRSSPGRGWLWAAPIVLAAGAVVLVSGDLLNPPTETPSSSGQLDMPGDKPPSEVERAQGIDFALKMAGKLASATAEQIVIHRGEEQADAVIFLGPETILTLNGESVSFDELPTGGDVLATFDLEGARRVALRVDAMPPGEGPPDETGAAPIIPEIPGARLEDGLPPGTAPAQPPEEKPRKLPRK